MSAKIRPAATILLLLGLVAVAIVFPSAPAERWEFVHAFEVDSEECRTLRAERETVPFVRPRDVDGAVTFAEVARRYNLELRLVCQANGLANDCGSNAVGAGDEILLPLARNDVKRPAEDETPASDLDRGGDEL